MLNYRKKCPKDFPDSSVSRAGALLTPLHQLYPRRRSALYRTPCRISKGSMICRIHQPELCDDNTQPRGHLFSVVRKCGKHGGKPEIVGGDRVDCNEQRACRMLHT